MREPPRGARALLRRVLPERDRKTVPGELEELYRERARTRGPGAARWWYRRQVLAFVVSIVRYAVVRRLTVLKQRLLHPELFRMDAIARDVRMAGRTLLRRPGFTLVAVLSLALGIGANTAIFSLVNAVLLRDLPVEEPDRLVNVYTSDSSGGEHSTFSYPDYVDLRDRNPVFEGVAAYELFIGTAQRDEGSELVMGEVVSGDYFGVLGVEPALGRAFSPAEGRVRGRAPVAVLSWDAWQQRFGGSSDVIGRTLRINQRPFTVVGVAPEDFTGLFPALAPDLWVPMAMMDVVNPGGGDRLESRGSRSMFLKARLRPEVTIEQARRWVKTFAARLAEAHPASNENRTMTVLPSSAVSVHPAVDRALVPVAGMLLAVVAVVLLIACTNLASFLLARAEDRRKDIAVRLALGAGRGALIRQLLVESVVLSLLGAVGGVVLAEWTLGLLLSFQPPVPLPVSLDLSLDGRVFLFTAAVAVLAGVVLGLVPALQSTDPDVAPALKEGGAPEGPGTGSFKIRNALVVAQVAMSFVLLIGAGLFLRSLWEAQAIDPGFDTGPAAILWPEMDLSGLSEEEGRETYRRLRERLLAHPVIEEVAIADPLPLGVSFQSSALVIPGVEAPTVDGVHHIDHARVDSAYFPVMDVPLVRGRNFRTPDTEGDVRRAIVSEAFVRRFWPGEQAVGRTIETPGGIPVRIVGVAADTKVRTLGEDPRPRIYFPVGRQYLSSRQVIVKGPATSRELLTAARQVAREVEPDLVFFETKTMEEHLSLMLFAPRMAALLLAVFGGLALLLAAVGIYGVVSYAVAKRTREMGIRLSLGAEARDVVSLMVRGGLRVVLLGGVVGLGLAALLATLVSRFLIGVSSTDVTTFVTIPAVLLAVAVVAAWIPARRAARVDPVRALKTE